MTEKMLLNSCRPFLPRLSESLTNKIDSMTDQELMNLIDKAEDALAWLLD